MTYSSKQDILSQFVVIQDGEVDLDYAEAHEKAARTALLKDYTRHTGKIILSGLTASMKLMGNATLELFELAAEEGRRMQ